MGTRTPLLLLALLASLGGSARAEDLALAQQHDRMARAEVTAGHIDGAIREFDLAFKAAPNPKYLFNKALLAERLATGGSMPWMRAALAAFQQYVEAAPSAADRKAVEGRIVELRARLESAERLVREPGLGPDDSPGFIDQRSAATPSQPSIIVVPPPELPVARPSRKRLWIGLGVGAVIICGGIVGLAVGFTRPAGDPSTSLGSMEATFK